MDEYFVSEKNKRKNERKKKKNNKKRSKMYKGGSLQRKEVEKKGVVIARSTNLLG